MFREMNKSKKLIVATALGFAAILSLTVLTKFTTNASNYTSIIQTLDDKKMTAMEMTAAVAASSTAIAAMPGDSTTPIATQLSKLTTPLLVIVCAIYLEKFLLTTIGYVSFAFLIPIACISLIVYLFLEKSFFKQIGIKIATFAVIIYMIIPISVTVMNLIEDTFNQSIQDTFTSVEEIEVEEDSNSEEVSSWISGFISGIESSVSNITEGTEKVISVFVDAIAVLIITTCVIPIAIIFLAIWIIKILFGIKIEVPKKIGFVPNTKN